jgi:hypothetical protein
MAMKKERQYSSPYSLDGRLPLSTAVPLGLQHVLAMFVGYPAETPSPKDKWNPDNIHYDRW